MEKRPLSLTIIAWWLVIGALFSLYSLFAVQSNAVAMKMIADRGLPMIVYQAIGVVGIVVALASAYGILKGLAWSRVLYVAWGIVGVILSFLTSPAMSFVIVGIVVLAIIAFFLFRPAANRWFGTNDAGLRREA